MSLISDTGIQPPPCKRQHKGSGPTSYQIQDAEQVFAALELQPDEVVVDIGCGRGDYSFRAAEVVGARGRVYALDYWSTYTDSLKERASEQGLVNLFPLTADIRKQLPLSDNEASICLLFTVLHATTLNILDLGLGKELRRIVCPGGRVAVLELKKEETLFGPPLKQRLSAEQVTEAFLSWKFSLMSITDLGYTNLVVFQKQIEKW
ncbi:class I SAM-dependent methyltransferase [Desulfogranum japonicum]|uniref:class I SAM-dependent methyltransferase n=1 Tax=Desulfogranum japonicum TaxID=231447 RepID=UPI00041344BD|nr:class I SAM-dependent methyltransferase [Desulfogranum japonicum]